MKNRSGYPAIQASERQAMQETMTFLGYPYLQLLLSIQSNDSTLVETNRCCTLQTMPKIIVRNLQPFAELNTQDAYLFTKVKGYTKTFDLNTSVPRCRERWPVDGVNNTSMVTTIFLDIGSRKTGIRRQSAGAVEEETSWRFQNEASACSGSRWEVVSVCKHVTLHFHNGVCTTVQNTGNHDAEINWPASWRLYQRSRGSWRMTLSSSFQANMNP